MLCKLGFKKCIIPFFIFPLFYQISDLKKAADEGDANAQCNYALCLRQGHGVRENKAKACKYFKMTADQGHTSAQYNYAVCLEKGNEVGENKVETCK
jgi:TPR repeat protein